MNKPVLVIMAAGMGSRFGGLKQIEPVSGKDEIILDFSLYDALRAGFEKAIIIIKKENEKDFRALIDNKAGLHMEIEYAFQDINDIPAGFEVPEGRVKPWGTSHAVLAARDLIDGSFAVINADDYYGLDAFKLIYDYLLTATDGEKYDFSMAGYLIENTLTENGHVSRGVCKEDQDGYLTNIDERTKIMWRDGRIVFTEDDGDTWTEVAKGSTVSMNFWGFTMSMMREMHERLPAFLEETIRENPMKGEFLLPRVCDALIKEGKASIKVLRSKDRWYGVTYKEDKESVVKALQKLKDEGVYPQELWKKHYITKHS